MLLAREETFGPVAPLFRFRDEAEALALANATPYGLGAYYYTQDLRRAWRVGEQLEFGMVALNTGTLSMEVAPLWRREAIRPGPRGLAPGAGRVPGGQGLAPRRPRLKAIGGRQPKMPPPPSKTADHDAGAGNFSVTDPAACVGWNSRPCLEYRCMNSAAKATDRLLGLREQGVPRGIITAHPVVVARAQGSEVWDVDGRRYLDFVGGIGVLNVGHNHPRVVEAVRRQVGEISHASFQVMAYEPYLELASRLNTLIGDGEAYKTLLLTSGAEAVENAIKIARAHTRRPGVIAFRGGFHGRTLLGVTLTGFAQPYKQNFGPFPGDIYHAPYPDPFRGVDSQQALAGLREVFATQVAPDQVAALLIEPVQGDGGFRPAPVEFLQALRALCDQHGIVLIADEIQTGFGRTAASSPSSRPASSPTW